MKDDLIVLLLEQYGDQIINDYRRKLAEGNANASGLLGNSLKTEVTYDDEVYEVSLRIQDYWKYLEYGREPGRFPNIDAIKRWIMVKPVLPTPTKNGKLPTIDQLTFLISRKIAREGIEPRMFLTNTIEELDLKPLEDAITELLAKRFTKTLKEV